MNAAVRPSLFTMLAGLVLMAAEALSAAPASPNPPIAMLGIWDRAAPLVERASRETGVGVKTLRVEELLDDSVQDRLTGIKLLYVLNISADQAEPLRKTLQLAKQANPELRIVPLDRRDAHAALRGAGLLDEDPQVPTYWRSNGPQNMRRLLVYSGVTYLGGEGEVEPAVQVPDAGYYAPESPEDAIEDLAKFKEVTSWKDGAPVAAMLIQQSFWITQDTKVIDAEIEALRARGMNVVTLFMSRHDALRRMLLDVKPDLIVDDRHGSTWSDSGSASTLEELDAPYLRPISMLAYTLDEWLKDPRGLSPRDVGHFMSLQESKGTIEPIVVGALKAGISGYRLHEPIAERIDRFADRAASWVRLRQAPNAEKRVAIVYYSKSLGKDDLLRGSPTGAFLDGPESLVRFLSRLAGRGYRLENVPATAPELIDRVRAHGRNVGPWAQGELDAMADRPECVLVSLERYRRWFDTRLTEPLRRAVIEKHGEPPGRLMVVRRNDRPFIVIPAVRCGNVLLAPQPERGEKQDERLLHARDVPPPHNYLAFYWWLQDEFRANAVVHWGTHGTLELQPGKDAGLTADDWSDLCVGAMPVVNLWIMDNLGEATLSRRRSYALLVDHLVPPAVGVRVAPEVQKLHDDLEKFVSMEPGLVREEFRKHVTRQAVEQRFHEALEFQIDSSDDLLRDDQVAALHEHLHVLIESRTPTSLHILGRSIERDKLPDYLVSILGKSFVERVGQTIGHNHHGHQHDYDAHHVPGDEHGDITREVRRMVEASVLGDATPPVGLESDIESARDIRSRLDRVDDEVVNLLRGLEGRYVAPGPGPDPIRNPSSAPSGRNLYALNPEEIPTRASWDVAVRLVNEMLRTSRPKKIGMDLNGMNTMRDFGVIEGQILYLMGVRPVWDANNLAVDIEIIPQHELGRSRVDVFIAMGGQYKENFPTRVKLLDKAVRLVSQLDENDNLVRAGTAAMEAKLLGLGFSSDRARALAAARIFGTKPGNFSGTNILHLVPRSGVWDSDDEIASVYIDSMSYAYTGDTWGEKIDGLYDEAIQGTDTILRVWASNMTSPLSNHHAYEYLGGMNLAVKKLTGKEPAALIADVRDPSAARVRRFEEALDTAFRTELLNEGWIRGMKEHDYAGAGHMAELVKNTFGWSVTRRSAVTDGTWNEVYDTYVADTRKLELGEWFERVNPHAFQEIAATMLEAARKGYWNASEAQIAELSRRYMESVAKHGPSTGLVSGGNGKLDAFVKEHLGAPGPLAVAYQAVMAKATADTVADTKVYGTKLQEETPQAQAEKDETPAVAARWWPLVVAAAALALLVIGIWKRTGSPA